MLFFAITLFIIITNIGHVPAVFTRIFEEAFGLRQASGRRNRCSYYERCEKEDCSQMKPVPVQLHVPLQQQIVTTGTGRD